MVLRRRTLPVVLGAAMAVMAIIVAGVLWLQRSRPGDGGLSVRAMVPRSIDLAAVEPNLRDLAGYCNDLADSDHPSLSVRPLRALQARLASVERRPGGADWRVAGMHLALARQLLDVGDFPAALDQLDEAARPGRELDTLDAVARQRLAAVDYTRAVVHLQAALALDCTDRGDPHSCLLFGRGGNKGRRHARSAVRSLDELLSWRPDNPSARWLLNMAHMLHGDYPGGVSPQGLLPAEVFGAVEGAPRFDDVARDLKVAAVNLLGGAIMDDFDNDGFLDIFTTSYHPCDPAIFYHNDGTGGFTDRSVVAGLRHQLGGFNAMQTDFNNDGFLDVLVVRGAWQFAYGRHRNSLLRNNGDGTFTDVTRQAGLASPAYPTQAAAWADFDNDGHLDVYIGNELEQPGVAYPSQLFRNNGDGTFTDVAVQAGVTNDRMAKGVAWGDYNNDGHSDLYVSNIGPNRLYRNNGDGTFTDVAPALGVEEPTGRSFVPWFWDYDNDGWLDIYVAGYDANLSSVAADYLDRPATGVRPRLYRNTGRGGFEDVTDAVGLNKVLLPMGANFGDIDNDGWLDFYLGTGDPDLETIMPNVMYRNEGGRRFVDVTPATGAGHLPKGHGVAFGDIDNDGDQDFYLQAGGFVPADASPNALFRNPGSGNHWITVRLIGNRSNRAAIGARLKLTVSDAGVPRTIYVTVSSGGSFGASSLQQEIGLGQARAVTELEVWWPTTAIRQLFRDVTADQFIEIEEGVNTIRVVERRRVPLGREDRAPRP